MASTMQQDTFTNAYGDDERAASYATLEFPGTYYLAFRDLPEIFSKHVTGHKALDFGCGTGRSTRFLKKHGYDTTGIDISENMVKIALQTDPDGRYLVVEDGNYTPLGEDRFDLILSAFAFDNIPGEDNRARLLGGLKDLLSPEGKIVILGSTPQMYFNDWASFLTKQFAQNREAKSGGHVLVEMVDVPDKRPVVDIFWLHEDYLKLFTAAGLKLEAEYRPLGRPDEPYTWVAETTTAPWVIYVIKA